MKDFINTNKKNSAYWIFIGIMLTLLFLLPFLAKDAGMSGDEDFQYKHAEAVLNYYQTLGKDTTAIHYVPEWNLPQYGQTVDNFASLIARVFHIDNVMLVRHIVNSLCGWATILLIGLICFRISRRWTAAIIGSVLMFLSPRFLGHSFNDIKDVSFALFMTLGVYYMVVYFQAFPKVKKSTLAMLAVSVGLATAVRVGGLLLIPFFGLFCLYYLIANYSVKGLFSVISAKYLGKMFIHGVIALLGGYVLALLLWPYAMVSPFAHVKETFDAMSNFGTALRQLFENSLVWSDSLPRYYTPKYIGMTIPIAVILGFFAYSFLGGWKKEKRFTSFVLYFAAAFPVCWLVYQSANVYGGWRHAMFCYPFVVAVAGLGFDALIEKFETKKKASQNKHTLNSIFYYVAMALPFLLLIPAATHIIRNHPYEYIYFNEIAGGVNKAYGNYELDYYYHTTREATEWVIKNAEKSGLETGNKIRVVSWHPASVGYYLRNDTAKFQNGFSRWYEKGNNDWDYAIFVVTGMAPEQIVNPEVFPPKNCVHIISVDKKPVCIILKRTNKADLLGFKAKEAHQNDSAIVYLEEAIALDPTNEAALANISEIYLQTGNPEKAKTYIDMLLNVSPKYETANFFLAHYYLANQQLDEALQICKQIIKNNFKFRAAYHLASNIYLRKNDKKSAENLLLKMLDNDQMDDQATQLLFEIYKTEGIGERAAYKKVMKKYYQSFEKRGKKKEAEIYRKEYKKL